MDGEIKSFVKVWITVLASLTYCYFIPRNIPKGFIRLFFILPIISIFIFLPLNLSSIHFIGITSFFITWLSNFKLLLFSFDKGPLSSDSGAPPLSLQRFLFISCLPIKIQQTHPSSSSSSSSFKREIKPKSPLKYAIKVLLLALMIGVLHDHDRYKRYLNPNFVLFLQWLHIYFIVEIMLTMVASLARFLIGFELEPPFNEPYLSTSLEDFWGRRWNMIVSDILLSTVSEPVQGICKRIFGTSLAQHIALIAMFGVSGLMHELIYFYFGRVWPTWEALCFFLLHGVCLAVEIKVKRCFTGRWQLHRLVSGPLTVGFVVVTIIWLFLPQYIRCGAEERAIEEYAIMGEFVKRLVGHVWWVTVGVVSA